MEKDKFDLATKALIEHTYLALGKILRCWRRKEKMKTINMMRIAKVVFIDINGVEMIINNISVEKLKSPINHYHLLGHNGEENCSGADVGMEFRSVPNDCSKNGRHCCNLPNKNEDAPTDTKEVA